MLFKKKKVNILLLDDSEISHAKLSKQLADPDVRVQLFWVKTVERALDMLSTMPMDIVLIDNLLTHGETGFDLLCHPDFKALKVPAIFIAGHGDEYVAVKALKAGAFDYLVKERCDSSRLFYAINEAIKDSDYRKKAADHQIELIKLATTDELTKLYNRRYFMQVLENEIARYTRYKLTLSVALLDVDHFKHINDEFGHDGGDYVLKELGELLQKTVRTTDTVCRYGGEEFAVIFPSTDLMGAERFGERLRIAVDKNFFYYDHMSIPVTVSIGVAEAYPEVANNDMLLKLADKALYAAKKDGRNRVISYKYGSGI